MTRPFRFAVQISKANSRDDWRRQAKLAESLGYSTCVLPDHIGNQLAPLPALVAVAEATDSIRVGTFVLDNDFRHPLLVAHEAATLDVLTDGRLELGLGAGWLRRDYEQLGVDFAAPRIRFERLKEAVAIIDSYLVGDPFSFEGDHYQVQNVEPKVRCMQRPRPPLLIGGGGSRLLALAAERADIISVFLKTLPEGSGFDESEATANRFDEKIRQIRRAAGRRFSELELNILLQYFELTNDRAASFERRASKWDLAPGDLQEVPLELIGTSDQVVENLIERREKFGVSYVTVFDKYMTEFAPIVERLSGT